MANSAKTEQRAFVALLVLFSLIVCLLFSPFLNALVLAIVLAVLFQPLHQKYLKWTRGRPMISAFLSVFSVVILLFLPLAALLTLVTNQISDLMASAQNTAAEPSVSAFISVLQQKLGYLGRKFEQFIGIQLNLAPFIRKEISQLAQTVAKYSPKVIVETANFFLHFFIMLILMLYFFRDGKKFINSIIRVTPIKDRYEHKLAIEIQKTIHEVFYGNFITGFLQAAFATLGFFLLGIEGYLVWGIAAFFMSFLPPVGTSVVVIPLIISLFLQGKTVQAVILIFYGSLVIGVIDNLVRPFLVNRNMHPIFLFLGVFGGLAVFGLIGLLLGPMLMTLFTATIRIYEEDFMEKRSTLS